MPQAVRVVLARSSQEQPSVFGVQWLLFCQSSPFKFSCSQNWALRVDLFDETIVPGYLRTTILYTVKKKVLGGDVGPLLPLPQNRSPSTQVPRLTEGKWQFRVGGWIPPPAACATYVVVSAGAADPAVGSGGRAGRG
jgi:hypothetical protein